jgi:hypothetical protein
MTRRNASPRRRADVSLHHDLGDEKVTHEPFLLGHSKIGIAVYIEFICSTTNLFVLLSDNTVCDDRNRESTTHGLPNEHSKQQQQQQQPTSSSGALLRVFASSKLFFNNQGTSVGGTIALLFLFQLG